MSGTAAGNFKFKIIERKPLVIKVTPKLNIVQILPQSNSKLPYLTN